jgi:hypothetical protein
LGKIRTWCEEFGKSLNGIAVTISYIPLLTVLVMRSGDIVAEAFSADRDGIKKAF